jgi:hypothetical protein
MEMRVGYLGWIPDSEERDVKLTVGKYWGMASRVRPFGMSVPGVC